ncbi:hypothetical protein GCM10009623_14120 [Nocardioides aestuarii]|uniref:FtsX-like permease family protein n=1 Tax=Nocardioides aestuarii TaxID=252231 RepID=A0ABW4TKZ2_9ACTN
MLALVLSRARAHPAPLLAVAVNVLIVCTLVAGIGATLPLVQQASLRSRLAEIPPDDAVVTYVTTYDAADSAAHDEAVRDELDTVTAVAGGEVVRRLDSGTYDQAGADGATWAFTAITGADDAIAYDAGRAPEAGGDPLEVAVPTGADAAVGDALSLRNRADDREVEAVVVGSWSVDPAGATSFGSFDGPTLVLPADDFEAVSGAGSSAKWRAVPALDRLDATSLDDLRRTASAALGTGVERAADAASATIRAEPTALTTQLAERSRELVVLRALLLVPAALLLLLGAACLFLVASALAENRRDEAALMRSRGAGPRQLFSPTLVESLALCGAAVAVSPLVARAVVRLGDLRPPLTAAAWIAAAIAGAVCLVALVLPVVLRALTGDRGEQLSVEKQRRRRLTALVAAVLLVSVLGALAVLQLRGFGDVVTGATGAATVDPFLVTSPALLLLALAVLVALLVLPLVLRALALGPSRGVSVALGTRFAARASGRTVPLALVVILASGTLAFAATQRLSSADAREARAGFEVGSDLRILPPASALRAGATEEQSFLAGLPGVTAVAPVRRDETFVEGVPAGVLVAPLPGAGDPDALPPGALSSAGRARLLDRPLRDPDTGVAIPDDATRLSVDLSGNGLALDDQVGLLFADPDGTPTLLTARARRAGVEVDLAGLLAPDSRLVAVRTGTPARRGPVRVVVSTDGGRLTERGLWLRRPGDPGVVTFGSPPSLPATVPVVLTSAVASAASLEVGGTFSLDVLGYPTELEVVAVVPYLRTATESDGDGMLLDSGSALPSLFVAGLGSPPDEWWLDVTPDRTADVTAAIGERPDVAESVVSAAGVSARLDDDPSTGGTALAELLVLTSGGGLVVGTLLLLSVVLLRRRERATQDRTLVTVGARRRDLLGVTGVEYALTTGAGMALGVGVGILVARVTLVSMTLGPDGRLLVPAPELHVPGPSIALPLLAMALVPLLAMVVLARLEGGSRR